VSAANHLADRFLSRGSKKKKIIAHEIRAVGRIVYKIPGVTP
jgi:hypothetical protein